MNYQYYFLRNINLLQEENAKTQIGGGTVSTATPSIAPIPTTYSGITYRSRTEARWAILFDLLNIRHEYEPCKVFTGESNYIADFVLPDLKAIVEVKPKVPTPVQIERISRLTIADVEYEHCLRLITSGVPGNRLYSVMSGICAPEPCVEPFELVQCAFCGSFDFQTEGDDELTPHRHRCPVFYKLTKEFDIDPHFWGLQSLPGRPPLPKQSPALTLAIEAATSISFDGGNFHERLDREKKTQEILHAGGAYGHSRYIQNICRYMLALKAMGGMKNFLRAAWDKDGADPIHWSLQIETNEHMEVAHA